MVNKAILVGNLGRDPEIRYTPSGMAVANFSVATTDKWKDKATGDMKEMTEWHKIVAFGKLGEICGEYLTKGKKVYIEGRIQTSEWEKDNIKRYTTKIVASDMKMLSPKGSGGDSSKWDEPPVDEYSGPPLPEEKDDDIPF